MVTEFHTTLTAAITMALAALNGEGGKDITQLSGEQSDLQGNDSERLQVAKKSLLRSKGFLWMATSSAAAYFMSHAGI